MFGRRGLPFFSIKGKEKKKKAQIIKFFDWVPRVSVPTPHFPFGGHTFCELSQCHVGPGEAVLKQPAW